LENYDERKHELVALLRANLEATNKNNFFDLISKCSDFFSEFEEDVCKKSSSDKRMTEVEKEDLLNSIKNILDFLPVYNELAKLSAEKIGCSFELPDNLLATSEAVYNNYREKESMEMAKNFRGQGIPSSGFSNRKKLPLQTTGISWGSVIVGIVLLVLSFVIAFILDVKSDFQYMFARLSVILGIALVLTGLCRDFIEVKMHIKHRLSVTAFGAIAVFCLLYFFNPPSAPKYSQSETDSTQKIELNKD